MKFLCFILLSSLRLTLLFAAAGMAFADADSDQLLARVRVKVVDELKTIPRFICRQRIERRTMKWQGRVSCAGLIEAHAKDPVRGWKLTSGDRANLDVLLTQGTEMFSWPGAHKFEVASPGDLLVRGMSGAGDFGSFLFDIFSGNPRIQFKYEGACDGPACVRFSFDVPLGVSRYAIRTQGDSTIVEYDGSFDVNPRTADLLKLRVHPRDLHHLDICDIQTAVVYSRASTTSGAYMIPQSTQRDAYYAEGSVYENKTTYESCRQYSAESVLKPTDDAPAADQKPPAPPPSPPPSGTTLHLRLLTKIDSESNAAGDPVEAEIANTVHGAGGRVVATAGTIVRGHITQLEHYATPAIVLRLHFDAIVLGGDEVPITLQPSFQKHLASTGNFVFSGGKLSLGRSFVSEWIVRPPSADSPPERRN